MSIKTRVMRFNVQDMTYNLQMFNNTNVTTDAGMSVEMKTYYDDKLIDNAQSYLVHDQFAQTKDIPANKGKIIEFRRCEPLPKNLTPLVEGVTPNGKKLTYSAFTSEVRQYGDYVELSDIVQMTAIDKQLLEANKLLGEQAGETLDTITREVINGGTSVQYADDPSILSRYALDATKKLTVKAVQLAVRWLKVQKAKKINGYYVAIAHPDTLYDLMRDPEWIAASQYAGSTQIFEGEVGRIAGCRFVETTEAKIFAAPDFTAASRTFSVKTAISASTSTIAVKEAITAAEATALVGRKILIGATQNEIVSAEAAAAGSATITVKTAIATLAADAVLHPGEAGKDGLSVYSTLVLGQDAYATTKLENGGLEMIVKQLGSGGTTDPLNQRATAGWKATKTAEILTQTFLRRIETGSSFSGTIGIAN